MRELTITEVSELAGVSAHTLRYWEKEKLLSPHRDQSTQKRIYSQKDVFNIFLIIASRELGYSIKDCRIILALDSDPELMLWLEKRAKELVHEIQQCIESCMKREARLQNLLSVLADTDFHKITLEDESRITQSILEVWNTEYPLNLKK